jgi:tRNA-binding EMAP/Myf-like protein
MSIDISQYRVGVIISLEDCGNCRNGGKTLRACKVRIGGTDDDNYDEATDIVTVVTSAPNVRILSRVVVAPAGSSILAADGEFLEVKKVTVGGVSSEGMLCDSKMLGWIGGAKGIAVNLADSFGVGTLPPSSKPRPNDSFLVDGGGGEKDAEPAAALPGLFEKKLSKEEKKSLAAERKAKKMAAKDALAKGDEEC